MILGWMHWKSFKQPMVDVIGQLTLFYKTFMGQQNLMLIGVRGSQVIVCSLVLLFGLVFVLNEIISLQKKKILNMYIILVKKKSGCMGRSLSAQNCR